MIFGIYKEEERITKFMKLKYTPLIFSLFCGISYFGIIFSLILNYTQNGGGLLAFFFCPAIICGSAIFIIKAIKMYLEEENTKKINFLFWSHIVLFLVSLVLVIGAIA